MNFGYKYSDGGRKTAGYRGRANNDCVCRALAIVSGEKYAEVYQALNKYCDWERKTLGETILSKNWSANNGISFTGIRAACTALGARHVELASETTPPKFILESKLPSGKLILELSIVKDRKVISAHFAAMRDGVLYDLKNSLQNGLVFGYWIFGDKH